MTDTPPPQSAAITVDNNCMTDDNSDEHTGTIHLHRLAEQDDWHRIRLYLSALHVAMAQDWPDELTRQLADHTLLIATAACSIEVTAGEDW